MEKNSNNQLTPTDFYLIRTPSFSIESLSELNGYLEEQNINAIKEAFSADFFLKAVYFSSREFYEIAKSWLSDDSIRYDCDDRILMTLYKYYNRICSRSTPYGLFAGFSLGEISTERSNIEFCKEECFEPIFRTDMLFLNRLKKEILTQEGDTKILFYPNNTIYQVGNNLRFIEWDDENNYKISEATNNELLADILQSAKAGITKAGITSIISKCYDDLEQLEIMTYIDTIITSKILVDQLPPYLTSRENPIYELYQKLKDNEIESTALNDLISFVESQGTSIDIVDIEKFSKKHSNYLSAENQLFQVDLKLNLRENNLNTRVIEDILRDALELMAVVKRNNSSRITSFKNKFITWFENKEIPLIHALDPQLGIGYDLHISGNVEDMPLLNNIEFSYETDYSELKSSSLLNLILKKYIRFFDYSNQRPIVLSEEDIRSVTSNTQSEFKSNNDYYLFGDLLSDSLENLDKGNFKFFCKSSIPTPYMSNLFSRFAYHDRNIEDKLRRYTEDNESLNYICAEVIHHPGGRVGNILLRPQLFNYEIPYVTNTNSAHNQININDIMVSIRNDEVFLRSKTLNKEIRPRLSSAHNFSREQLPVFRFLCDVQYQNINTGLNWDWSFLSNQTFLPRIEYKKIILSEARWKISKNKGANLSFIREQIIQLKIPKDCKIKEGDNFILIDTTNVVCLNILINKVKQRDINIYENLNNTCFISKDGREHCAEFIFPLINKNSATNKRVMSNEKKTINRDFYPGEDWVYFKIYCSHMVGDTVITSAIKNTIESLKAKDNKFLVWFFVRLDDPGHHIRFRIKSTDVETTLDIFNKHLKSLTDDGLIFSFQLDTYKREVERYGVENIELSETLFCHDSNAMIQFLTLLNDFEDNEDTRWRTAIGSIALLLDDFNISIANRKSLFERIFNHFMLEFVNVSDQESKKQFKRSADLKLRKNKEFLDSVLRLKDYSSIEAFISPFQERSMEAKEIIGSIMENTRNDEKLLYLLERYIHMNLNRFFYAKARMHELVIYYFMFKTYDSILNRNAE